MINKQPLVSVAMATYNGEKYLKEQLDSILHQTYKNIELIITDDGSSDNTVQLINAYQQKYPQISLFVNKSNTGVTKTFEHSIKECKGEWIALADQDDLWEPNKIELLINETGIEDALYSNSLLVDKNGVSLQKEFSSLMNLRSYYSGAPFFLGNCIPGHTVLMKADFARRILPFPPNVMFDRWISFCASSNNGLKYVDAVLVKYRQHETNTVGVGRSKNRNEKITRRQKFEIKLQELKAYEKATINDEETRILLRKLIALFTRQWSFKRSVFFFTNMDKILVVKNKSGLRKILFCIKMFFKANY